MPLAPRGGAAFQATTDVVLGRRDLFEREQDVLAELVALLLEILSVAAPRAVSVRSVEHGSVEIVVQRESWSFSSRCLSASSQISHLHA